MYQIRVSKFDHPEQTEGQHTNGPPNVFVRVDNGPWFFVDGLRPVSKIESVIENLGFDSFLNQHCQPVKDLA